MEGNGTFIPQAFTDLLLFHMNISCAFVSIILISFPLQRRAETENSKGCGMRDRARRRGAMERRRKPGEGGETEKMRTRGTRGRDRAE